MAKVRGTSNIPIILGLILGILCFVCSFYSKSSAINHFTSFGVENITNPANAFLILGIVCSILIIFFSLISKKCPALSGMFLIILSVLYGVTAFSSNKLSIILFIAVFFIGVFCLNQKTYEEKTENDLY